MNFRFEEAIALLERTPASLEMFLSGLPDGWVHCKEGEGTWNAEEVIGHLIEAEEEDWIPRVKTLLEHGESRPFPPFDRRGTHPEFGSVTLRELLATWTVHDLTHIAQISRVMAERYREDVGPWHQYLGILNVKRN